MDAAWKLTGLIQTRSSVHQNSSRAHGEMEKRQANSLGELFKPKRSRSDASRRRLALNTARSKRAQITVSRARFGSRKAKGRPRGWEGTLYRTKRQENRGSFGIGEIELGSVCPQPSPIRLRQRREGCCAVGPTRQPKGRWVLVTSGRKERGGGCACGPRGKGNGPGKEEVGKLGLGWIPKGFPLFFLLFFF